MPTPLYFQTSENVVKVGVNNPDPQSELDVTGDMAVSGDLIVEGDLVVPATSSEAVIVAKDGAVGDQTDPRFALEIQNAGINQPELSFKYYDDEDPTPRKVAGLESTGTFATVRETRGSHFEGFSPDAVQEPTFRLNSYPEGTMALQMGAGGTYAAAGGMVRLTNVVTVTTAWPHGFGVGQSVNLSVTTEGSGAAFASGNYTIATVADSTHFTYADVASNSTSTGVGYWSAPVDVEVQRVAYNQMGFAIAGARKFSIYADSMTTEDSVRFATAGSLETSKITATTTTPYTLAVEYGVLVDATAGAKVVNLPAASGCKGRQYLIKKTDATGNAVTLTRAGSDTIDGATTLVLSAQYESTVVVSDGTATWLIADRNFGATASRPGLVTSDTQSFSGDKAFAGAVTGQYFGNSNAANAPQLRTFQADTAAAIGCISNTNVDYTTAGARIHGFYNHDVLKAFVDKDGNVEVSTVGAGFILKSPDGTRYKIAVSNLGVLSASAA